MMEAYYGNLKVSREESESNRNDGSNGGNRIEITKVIKRRSKEVKKGLYLGSLHVVSGPCKLMRTVTSALAYLRTLFSFSSVVFLYIPMNCGIYYLTDFIYILDGILAI